MSATVRFLNWWPGFQPEQSFVFQLLKRSLSDGLEVVTDAKAHVDVEAHSVFTRSRTFPQQAIRRMRVKLGRESFQDWRLSRDYGIGARGPAHRYLWYTGENLRPPTGWDATLSFDLDSFSGTNYYLPHWAIRTTDLGWRDPMDPMTTGSATLLSNRKTPGIPKKFACLLASNPHPMREQMANELRKVGDVDLYGRAYGKPVASKAHVLSEYRFVITPENDLYPGYVTEKAIEAWLSHTIPIWWGSDPAGYLNPDAVVNAAETSIDGLAEPVRLLDQNKDMWEKMISQPILRESFDYDDCIAFLKRQLQ